MKSTLQRIKVGYNSRSGRFLPYASPKDSETLEWDSVSLKNLPVKIVWKDNQAFTETFTIGGWHSTRTTTFVEVNAFSSGIKYVMKVDDFLKMAKEGQHKINGGSISGEFAFERKGGVASVVPFYP
jgi:hypothetical protein